MQAPLFYCATVKSTKDPLGLGRVQVVLKGFSADPEPIWLRMLNPMASNKTGFFFLPEADDEVIVLRGAGDVVEGMMILGSVYNGKNKPKTPDADGKNAVKEIRTKAGNAITISDKAGDESITLTTKSGMLKIVMSDKEKSVTIEGSDKVIITAKKEVSIAATEIKIEAKKALTLGGKAEVSIKGMKIAAEGTQMKLAGSAKVEIAGAMVDIG